MVFGRDAKVTHVAGLESQVGDDVRRIKIALLAVATVVVIGGANTGTANADPVAFEITMFGVSCDAQMDTSGGPPQTTVTLLSGTFAGQIGGQNPCVPTDFTINNNPVVTFSGGGPYNATVDSINITHVASGCNFVPSTINLTSSVSANGPYSGARTAAGTGGFPCTMFPGTATFKGAHFVQPRRVGMNIDIPSLGINCDAVMNTNGGPAPAKVQLVGNSFAGDTRIGKNPCVPADIAIVNNPLVTFSGSGPYNADTDQIVFLLWSTCNLTATGTGLTGSTGVDGPYAGSDTTVISGGGFICLMGPPSFTLSNFTFL